MTHTATTSPAPAPGVRFWAVWVLVLLGANAALFGAPGPDPARWILDPAALAAGEWWRWLTHPFIHASAYHLWLDGVGVLGVEALAFDRRPFRRAGLWLACLSGSALAALLAAPAIRTLGLCGLSGLGHGLLAHHLLSQAGHACGKDSRVRIAVVFAGLIAKCVWESVTGRVFLGSWHPGPLGQPIAVCHAGGALAGCLAALAGRSICLTRTALRPVRLTGADALRRPSICP